MQNEERVSQQEHSKCVQKIEALLKNLMLPYNLGLIIQLKW